MLMSNGAGALDGPAQGDLWARRSVIRSCPFVLLRPGEAEESGPGGEGASSGALLSRKYFKITSHFTALYTLLRHSFWSGDGGVM